MRFMLLVIPKGYESAAPDAMPDAQAVEKMMAFSKSMRDAGILRGMEGLRPPSMGARITFSGGKPTVSAGPFPEAKEVLGGYWMIDVRSTEDAVAWASRCPAADNEILEVRQVEELADFPPDIQQIVTTDFPESPMPKKRRKTA